ATIAFVPLGAPRGFGYLTSGDAIGPVGEHRERTLMTEHADGGGHLCTGLAGLHATLPLREARGQRLERIGNPARADAAELVARHARPRLDRAAEVRLRLHVRRHAV